MRVEQLDNMDLKARAKSFDEYHFDNEPKLGSWIIQIVRFATLQIVNIDPQESHTK
jgi:hypothetical protein